MHIFGSYNFESGMDQDDAHARYFEQSRSVHSEAVSAINVRLSGPQCCVLRESLICARGSPRLKSGPNEPLSAIQLGTLYERRGETFLTDLCGAFSIAIVDPRQRRMMLAID